MLPVISGDIMLTQWAAWSTSDLRRLDYSRAGWQVAAVSGWPEERESVIPEGDDGEMERVERAVNALRRENRRAYWEIRRHYLDGHRRPAGTTAIRAFLHQYEKGGICVAGG